MHSKQEFMINPFEIIESKLNVIEDLLLNLYQSNKPPDVQISSEELLTVEEAAKFLSLSKATIYKLIHKGEIPFMKRSKRCYFSKSELLNYLKQGNRKSNSTLISETDAYLSTNKKSKTSKNKLFKNTTPHK